MKRLFVILLVLLMTVSCCACGSKETTSGTGSTNNTAPTSGTASSGVGNGKDYMIDNIFFRTYQGTDGEHFQASFRVTNTGNTLLYLTAAFWNLKDSSGKSITTSAQQPGTFAYPQVISPGEASWYYINALTERMTDGSGDIADAEPVYQMPPRPSEENDYTLFPVSDLRLEESSGNIIASGSVENNSDRDSYILVYVNLFDKDGNLVGQLSADSLAIEKGDKKSFTAASDTRKNSGELALALSSIACFDAVAVKVTQ